MEEILKKIVSYVKVVGELGGSYERFTALGDLSRHCDCTNSDVIHCLFEQLDKGFLISYFDEGTKEFKNLKKDEGIRNFKEILTSHNHFKIRHGSSIRPIRRRTKNRV